jgi:hypothetical protein
MNMVLNDDNKARVQQIVEWAMTNSRIIEHSRNELTTLRSSAERLEEVLRQAERERDRYNRELKALGFHDVGHARTELAQIEGEKNATHL